jgi:hypothetical protein
MRFLKCLIKCLRGDSQTGTTVTLTDDEVRKVLDVRQKLRQWYNLATQGVIGAPASEDLKSTIMEVVDLVSKLYGWYVPPFTINTAALSEQELQNVINDLQSKGGMKGWLRLDGTYYTTDMETFKKVVEWDWTDTRKYVLNRFDCDKFAMYFKSRMAVDFHINAIGVILDYSAGHAYNLVILKDSQGVRYYLFEPQNDSIFTYEGRDRKFYTMGEYYLLM